MTPILGVLAAIFVSFSAADFVGDPVGSLLPAGSIAALVGLKVLISLEVLIPISLYLAVVIALSRFSSDSELVAAYALRVTPARVRTAVITVSALLAVAVSLLSFIARPWAYGELHRLYARAESRLDVGAMRPGTFYVGRNGDRVIFFSGQDRPGGPAKDVFVQIWHGSRMEVIHAGTAIAAPRAADGSAPIALRHAHVYRIDPATGADDRVLQAEDMTIDPNEQALEPGGYSSVAASSWRLLGSGAPADVAELQWRLSTGVSTLLLGLLGVPMSQFRPREGRHARLAAAILTYVGYYMLFTSARTWVQHGTIAAFPGVWWVPAMLGVLVFSSLCAPGRNFEYGHGRA